MARFSTGLRNAVASEYGVGVMMNGGILRVYGGTAPDTPDEPPGTPELARVTTEGRVFIPVNDPNNAGLYLKLISPGSLVIDPAMGRWKIIGIANGIATWWRWNWRWADDQLLSTYYPRMDGTLGVDGEFLMQNTSITTSTNSEVEQFLFILGMGA